MKHYFIKINNKVKFHESIILKIKKLYPTVNSVVCIFCLQFIRSHAFYQTSKSTPIKGTRMNTNTAEKLLIYIFKNVNERKLRKKRKKWGVMCNFKIMANSCLGFSRVFIFGGAIAVGRQPAEDKHIHK